MVLVSNPVFYWSQQKMSSLSDLEYWLIACLHECLVGYMLGGERGSVVVKALGTRPWDSLSLQQKWVLETEKLSKARPMRRAGNLAAICEPIV
jgi:hypothetical protein